MDQSNEYTTFTEKELSLWLDSPVTRSLKELIKDHLKGSQDAITEGFLNVKTKDIDMYSVAELKGQVQALDNVLNITEFLDERLEKRTVNEEDDSIR